MVMIGHYVVPALTGNGEIPIFASEAGIGFVRGELGFDRVVITDALDMGAVDQGPTQAIEVVAMMRAGIDLLMCMPDPDLQERVRGAVERGYSRGLIPEHVLAESRRRIERMRKGIAVGKPDPALVGRREHLALAADLAERSVTVVRNDQGLLPLRLDTSDRILSLEPVPSRVTPADTTNLYPPSLAAALRAHHPQVTDVVYPHRPGPTDISAILDQSADHQLVVVGTVNAGTEQADLVNGLLQTGKPVISVALRSPYDLMGFPTAPTHLCTYGALEPSVTALARSLFQGTHATHGSLPVSIPGLHPRGHGLSI